MTKKILLIMAAAIISFNCNAAWDFRGEPNGWGATRMIFVGEKRHFIRQSFFGDQDEFKVARDDGWQVSFPVQNFRVTPSKTFDITFFEDSKKIQVDEVDVNENWVFRGTPNNWGITPMTKNGSLFTLCQNFNGADPGFKISNGNKPAWVEAYPEANFRVPANASVDITFNPNTREIRTSLRSQSCDNSNIEINTDRSLFIRDQATLSFSDASGPVFNLKRVLAQLASQFNLQNPARTTSAAELFARMWDSQNEPQNAVFSDGPKCTGFLNGFPAECRFAEGDQARTAEASMQAYIPIALVNRFDLHDSEFNNCGEYRIIFARNDFRRNFIIFEAQLPNPIPTDSAGCLPIVNFWKELSGINSDSERAQRLADFYFQGLPGSGAVPPVGAVFNVANYGENAGQIRTNEFMGNSWLLKEFKTVIEGGLSHLKPVSVKANPFGELFNQGLRNDNLATQFRADFIKNMGSLLNPDLSVFSLTVENDAHNNGQSHASGDTFENDFLGNLGQNSASFKDAVQSRVLQLGSNLSADQVINRATAMTCAGCHNPGAFGLTFGAGVGPNQFWPQSLGFTHVNEFAFNGKFDISDALKDVFLPARKTVMESFLQSFKVTPTLRAAPALLRMNILEAAPAESTTPLTGKRSG